MPVQLLLLFLFVAAAAAAAAPYQQHVCLQLTCDRAVAYEHSFLPCCIHGGLRIGQHASAAADNGKVWAH